MSTTESSSDASREPLADEPNLKAYVDSFKQKIRRGLGSDDAQSAGTSPTAKGTDSFGAYATAGRDEKYDNEQFVLFFLGGQPYGLPIQSVIEIIRPLAITPVPNCPDGIEGLVNLRGRTLPVIDLATWLDMPLPTEPRDEEKTGHSSGTGKRIIVYQAEHEQVGFVVDEVAEVIAFTEGQIGPIDALSERVHGAEVRGHAQHSGLVVTLLESIEVAA